MSKRCIKGTFLLFMISLFPGLSQGQEILCTATKTEGTCINELNEFSIRDIKLRDDFQKVKLAFPKIIRKNKGFIKKLVPETAYKLPNKTRDDVLRRVFSYCKSLKFEFKSCSPGNMLEWVQFYLREADGTMLYFSFTGDGTLWSIHQTQKRLASLDCSNAKSTLIDKYGNPTTIKTFQRGQGYTLTWGGEERYTIRRPSGRFKFSYSLQRRYEITCAAESGFGWITLWLVDGRIRHAQVQRLKQKVSQAILDEIAKTKTKDKIKF